MEYANLEEVKCAAEKCRACPLCETKTNTVFGIGNENAELMFVGEAPGEGRAEGARRADQPE